MAKTRVGVLVREKMGTSKSMNKSADLAKLTSDYAEWCKKIRTLIIALKTHLGSLQQIEKTRSEVAKCFASFSKETPLYECVGLLPSEDRPASTVCSFASIHNELGAKTKSYCMKYQQFVVDYAMEWEKVVRSRIDAGLKKAEEMRRDLDHYQKKVEALRLSTNQAMAKGKSVPAGTQEKLSRNEEKLMQAKQNYNRVATDLVILMEEVTERSWRDLHPLLIKCAQFDMTLSGDEAKALGSLSQVVSVLKQVASEKGISPQPRLQDLAGLKPELLSTRPGGVAGLQIEYGGSSPTATGGASATGAFGATALAPGSVGPQGMGGFPVALSPMSGGIPRTNSYSSTHSAPLPTSSTDPFASSMNMLAMPSNPAPAPTTDDIYSTAFNQLTIQPTPSTGSLPPLPPSSSWNPSYRSASFNDADSAYSGYSGISAPPVSAPPPPPSMPPPPPPGGNFGLPPMAPSSRGTSMSALDPYGGGGAASSTGNAAFGSSPWSSVPPQQSQSMYSGFGQPPPPQPNMGGFNPNPSQNSQSNQGYNPFG